MGTEIERTHLVPETRDAAIRYLTRTGNADVLEALGLDGNDRPLVIDGQPCCPACREPYRGDGRTSCRRRKCTLGPTARLVAKPATEADEAFAAEYEGGATIVELARRHRRSQDFIRTALLRAGVELRRAVRRPVSGGAR